MEELGQAKRTTGHGHHSLLDHDHHGWTAVPRSLDAFLKNADESKVKDIPLTLIKFPTSDVIRRTREYVQQELPEPTYNHSMRVFYWGLILLKTFPDLEGFKETPGLIETFYLSCLLHDIGTIPANIKATRLSFELWGAIKASSLLAEYGSHQDQADLVAETINRHQDLGESGKVPIVLALIYFGTLFDNVGANGNLIHKSTIKAVCEEYPRISWSSCFSSTIGEEISEKPWSHTTVIDDFAEKVEGNKLMQSYD